MSTLAAQSQRWLSSGSGSLDQVACLKDVRNVLRLSGPTLIHFLQGLLTNDVTLLEKPNPSPLYSCILNAQGRYLHDLFLHPLSTLPASAPSDSSSSSTLLLDVDSNGKNDLVRLLKRYRLREKIEIDDVSEEWHVWTQFSQQRSPKNYLQQEKDDNSPDSSLLSNKNHLITNIPSLSWPIDPRLPVLGYRTLLPASILTDSTSDLTFSDTGAPPLRETVDIAPWDAYRRWRISLGVPEGDIEIPSGEAIALEYNIDGLNGISFTKGCYVGQELMARTHFKGVVRKRVMPVVAVQSKNELIGEGREVGGEGTGLGGVPQQEERFDRVGEVENIVDSNSGKVLGSLRVFDKEIGQGLVLLRLKEAHEAIQGQRVLKTEYTGIEILPKRPEWWPETWGREQ